MRQPDIAHDRHLVLVGDLDDLQRHRVLSFGGHLRRLHAGLVVANCNRQVGRVATTAVALGTFCATLPCMSWCMKCFRMCFTCGSPSCSLYSCFTSSLLIIIFFWIMKSAAPSTMNTAPTLNIMLFIRCPARAAVWSSRIPAVGMMSRRLPRIAM